MGIAYPLQAIWAVIVIWYVVERLLTAQGRITQRHPAHHPILAASRFWGAFWDCRHLALGLCAAVVGAQLLLCACGFLWGLLITGTPTGLASPSLQRLLYAQPAAVVEALGDPVFWSLSWLQLVDAVVLFPAFELGYQADILGAILLGGFCVWGIANRRAIAWAGRAELGQGDRGGALLVVGFTAALLLLGLSAFSGDAPGGAVRSLALAARCLATLVLHGGLVGLVALTLSGVVLSRPVSAPHLLGRWLALVPSFVALMAVPAVAGTCARALAPDISVGGGPPLAGVLWLVSRVSWLAAMPVVVWLAFEGGPLAEAIHGVRRLLARDGRDLAVGLVRGTVLLLPLLLALNVLNLLAPTSGLLPGAAVVLASWLLGLTCLGAAMTVFHDTALWAARRG